jgi:hypothetical protein
MRAGQTPSGCRPQGKARRVGFSHAQRPPSEIRGQGHGRNGATAKRGSPPRSGQQVRCYLRPLSRKLFFFPFWLRCWRTGKGANEREHERQHQSIERQATHRRMIIAITRADIALAIGILGFLLGVFNLWLTWKRGRVNLKVTPKTFFPCGDDGAPAPAFFHTGAEGKKLPKYLCIEIANKAWTLRSPRWDSLSKEARIAAPY